MFIAFLDFHILVGTVAVQERRTDTFQHDVLSKSFEEIDSSSNSSIFTKGYQPIVVLIDDSFVVDESDVLLEDGVEAGHVAGLGFDCMGEVDKSFIGHEVVNRDFFDA